MKKLLFLPAILFLAFAAFAQDAKPATPDWVKRSNEIADYVLKTPAKFNPEGSGSVGVEGLDEEIVDLKPGIIQRSRAVQKQILAELKKRRKAEKAPNVLQDIDIMIDATERGIRGSELGEKYNIPYFNAPQFVFGGIRALLDDQIPAERRKAALVRLRKYTGMEQGYTPITKLAEERIRERMNIKGLIGPAKQQLERDLGNYGFMLNGIEGLFKKYQIAGYEEPLAKLKEQFADYEKFIRTELMPKARTDFRLPEELYANSLDQFGVDIPPAKLAAMAHAAYDEIQKEMQSIAAQIAKERGWEKTDYRDVIRELKKEQLVGEAILPHYQERLKQLEDIIRREKLVTLPTRPAQIKLSSEAESAASPAPNMRPPRLIGNTGEQGTFMLPLNIPTKEGEKALQYDDFTFAAASWTLTAHEARPGHEMQFASVLEKGVSTARAVFAFNSTNVEGWGLYSERIVKPFMPLEGQLISLQHRMLRASRAFLDPELQMGKVTPEQAMKHLTENVVLSEAMATQEVERYTFRAPGQATSYFYGYTRLNQLRDDVEKKLGKDFDQMKFHDFVLAQGLLPPDLMRAAVMEEFGGKKK